MPKAGPEEIKQLLLGIDSDDEAQTDGAESVASRQQATGSNSSSNSSRSKGYQSVHSRDRDRNIESRIYFLKRIAGGFPAFDAAAPDPGCEFEALAYRRLLDPSFDEEEEYLSVSSQHGPSFQALL